MQHSFISLPLETDVAGKYQEFGFTDTKSGKTLARLTAGTWGIGVVRFDGSPATEGETFAEIASGNRLSAESALSTEIDLTCIRRLRAVVHTASGVSGSLAQIYLTIQNPNYK
jgi:hypothetical protein